MTTSNNRQDTFTQEEREQEIALTDKRHAISKALQDALTDGNAELAYKAGLDIIVGRTWRVQISGEDIQAVTELESTPNDARRDTPKDLHYDYPGVYDRGE